RMSSTVGGGTARVSFWLMVVFVGREVYAGLIRRAVNQAELLHEGAPLLDGMARQRVVGAVSRGEELVVPRPALLGLRLVVRRQFGGLLGVNGGALPAALQPLVAARPPVAVAVAGQRRGELLPLGGGGQRVAELEQLDLLLQASRGLGPFVKLALPPVAEL